MKMSRNQMGGSGSISTIAIVLAVFLLILLLVYYYNVYKNNINKQKKKSWPPNGNASCPDYWVNYGDGVCVNPFKVGDIDNCRGIKKIKDPDDLNKMIIAKDFNSQQYTGDNGDYNKCIWAKSCKTPWEGIDNSCA